MANFDQKLPVETLNHILEYCAVGWEDYAAWTEIRRTFCALCRASPTLNQVAISFLCRSFTDESTDKTAGFIKMLCTYPNLVTAVAKAKIVPSPRDSSASFSPSDLDMMVNHLSTAMSDRCTFYKIAGALASGCCNALSMVLLSVATKLRALEFAADDGVRKGNPTPCLACGDMLQRLQALFSDSNQRALYNRLEDVVVSGNAWRDSHASYHHFLPLLKLPALRSFDSSHLSSPPPPMDPWTGRPMWFSNPDHRERSSTLESITLRNAKLETFALQDIIARTKVLTDLHIEYEVSQSPQPTGFFIRSPVTPNVWTTAVLSSLQQHQERLQKLTISHPTPYNNHVFEHQRPFTTLADFVNLRQLTIDEYLLRSVNVDWSVVDVSHKLPPSLEKLVLHTYDSLPELGPICLALTNFQGQHLSSVEITLPGNPRHLDYDFAARLPVVEGPLNAWDIGCLHKRDAGSYEQIFFAIDWQKPELTALALAAVGAMLTNQPSGDITLDRMFHYQSIVAMKEEDKSVYVYEADLGVAVNYRL